MVEELLERGHEVVGVDDFNISTDQETTVLELAELIWRKVKGEMLDEVIPWIVAAIDDGAI